MAVQASADGSSLALDGSAKNGCGYVSTCSVSMTTTQPSDVIVVGCNCWPNGAAFTVRDTAGLTFAPRTVQVGIGGGQFIQTWYAIAPAPLTGDSISVVTTDTGETWYGVVAFAVSGANTTSPFDSNATLPASQANTDCPSSAPCSTGVSTSGPDFVFQFGGDTGYTHQTAGAGFTMIRANTAGQNAYAQYEVTSAPLSSATLSFGTGQGSDFGAIADAIVPATAGSITSTTSPPTETKTASTSTTTTTTDPTSTTTSTSSTTTSSSSRSTTTTTTTDPTSTTTSTSSRSTTTSTSASTAGSGSSGNGVFYLGAQAAGSSNPSNTGVRSSIDVESFLVPIGCVAFWVSDASAANIWMQAGYYICDGSTPVVFMQVWNLDSYTVIYTRDLGSSPTLGTHLFSVYLQSGTTWVATYDGTVIGSYNLQASSSSTTYPVYAVSEENELLAPILMPTVTFPVAIQELVNGAWTTPVVEVYNLGGAWGMQALTSGSFEVGGLLSTPGDGWSF
jgi:hypothetical protein